jgi:hypothetical protein
VPAYCEAFSWLSVVVVAALAVVAGVKAAAEAVLVRYSSDIGAIALEPKRVVVGEEEVAVVAAEEVAVAEAEEEATKRSVVPCKKQPTVLLVDPK